MPKVLNRALEQRLKGVMEMKDIVFCYTNTDKPRPTRDLLCNVPKFYVYMTTCMYTTVQGIHSKNCTYSTKYAKTL